MLGLVFVFYPFVALPTLVVAGPLYFLLDYFGGVSFWTILSCGSLVGLFCGVGIHYPRTPSVHNLLALMAMGGLSSLIFWLVWRRQFIERTD
jgi:hypothetical protein